VASPLADLLATNLARAPSLRIISSARMLELLAQSGADVADAGAYSSAARRAGASMLVDGSLYSLPDGGLRLDLRRIDVATGDVLDARTVNGGDQFALVDSGTARITEALGAAAPPGSIADVTTHSEVAFRFYEEGLRVYYRGDFSAAVGLFEAALAEDSTFAMAAYYAFRSTPDGDRRIPFINRAVSLAEAASDRERLIIRSAWATWTSDPSALAVTETLTVRYPSELEGYISRGLVLAQAGDNGAALENFRRVISADSFAPTGTSARCLVCDARLHLIETYVFMDSTGAAEREARLWTEREPLRAESWRLLSAILSVEDRGSEGRDAWRRAAAIDRSLNGHPLFFAWFYLHPGDYETADRELRQIAETGSPDRQLDAWWYLTLSLRRQGRFAEALAMARLFRERSVAARPAQTPHTFSFHQAQVLFEMGRFRESGALFDSIAAKPVGFSPSHRARYRAFALALGANALAAAGDTAELAARVDTIAALASQSLLIRDRNLPDYVRGLLFAARGDGPAAIEAFTRARYAPADFTRINLELARALLRMERPADAVAVLQPAVRGSMEGSHLYTTRTELEDLLATAWDEIGNADSALVHYRVVQHAWQPADPALADRIAAINARILALEPPARNQQPLHLP
jgi:tetratricopeptide (TPR) repeat protein